MPITTLTAARNAMATRFELVLNGPNELALRAAAEEALDEIESLEARLSLFRPESEIAHVNARAAREPVQVSPEVFGLLERAAQLSRETGGAFDITIAPLLRCWGFLGGQGSMPVEDAIAHAREVTGMSRVILNSNLRTVQFERPGVMLDLGAIGKGYAVEKAAQLLRDASVESGLLHGGTSTVQAIGTAAGGIPWRISIEGPPGAADPWPELALELQDEAMSVSAAWGKWFQSGEHSFGHVLDPRSGRPAQAALLAAVVLPSATETDALSTALLVEGLAGFQKVAGLRSAMRAWAIGGSGKARTWATKGLCIPPGEKYFEWNG